MIIPVQCFTCGKLIADKWVKYKEILDTHKHNNIQPDDYLYRAISLEHMEKGYGNEKSCDDYNSAVNLSKDLDYINWIRTEFLKNCD